MEPSVLQQYLHDHIPLSAAMQVEVVDTGHDGVVLRAPLGPNINHRDTVFGGSTSALAILAAWSLVHTRLLQTGYTTRIVIRRSATDYDRPIFGTYTAHSSISDSDRWQRFLKLLKRRGRARIAVSCVIESNGEIAGRFEGDFVALDGPSE